ncbi:amino acid adenylation domain-containing protein [Streptomyces lavendulae]|uniref:amino acid adenylation domain-containing protein n=1 Tax=Streptomyces lavendulae TaxID=1914 RepID=UPI0036EB3A2A
MSSSASTGSAPRTPREEILCGLFAELLGVPRIGVDGNFFEEGGDSLLAMRLISRIRAVFGTRIHIRKLFESPTVAGLARTLEQADQPTTAAPTTVALQDVVVPDRIPLSPAQRRLWLVAQVEGPNPRYNMPLGVRLHGPVDPAALEAALADVVTRHEPLRTVFPEDDGIPYQRVLDPADAHAALTTAAVRREDLDRTLSEAAVSLSFDITTDAPLRAWLFTTEESGGTEHVLLILMHHIAGDGWSLRPLLRDLAEAYEARLAGAEPGFTPLAVRYAQYSVQQHDVAATAATDGSGADATPDAQLEFWRQALAGAPEQLPLPFDRPRPATRSFRGAGVDFAIDADLHARLAGLARATGSTLFMVLQAALATVLTRYGAGEDIPIGTPVAGRAEESLDDVVGFFVNTLVLRTDTSGDPAFTALLDRVRAGALAAYAHQDVLFDRVVEALNPERSLAWSPLFQVSLAFNGSAVAAGDLPSLPGARIHEVPTSVSKFELGFNIRELEAAEGEPQGLAGFAEFATDLFDRSTVERLVASLLRVLEQLPDGSGLRLSELELLPAGTPDSLPERGVGAPTAPAAPSVPELFARQAAATPEAVALVCGQREVTYRELDARADALAARLVGQDGIAAEAPVAILMDRSVELVVAELAVLKAGAAYVPLDRRYPPSRIEAITAATGARFLLTDRGDVAALGLDPRIRVVRADAADGPVPVLDGPLPPVTAHPDRLAYIMFTSGSTGTPKGVMATHAGITALAADSAFAAAAHRRVLLHSSPAFDAATYELWVPLLNGGCCVLAPPGDLDTETLAAALTGHRVEAAWLTAALFHHMVEAAPDALGSLKEIWAGGEAVSATAVRRLRDAHPGVRVVNGYGPTETTTFATRFAVPADGPVPEPLPIGGPLDGMRAMVLDPRLKPAPHGATGELYLAGPGVARGYLGMPAATAERFVADPYGPPGSRMYRTGDLARWNTAGELECVGRTDDQVKIRGLRIEPGEVRAVLAEHPSVAEAAAVVREDRPGDKRLVAYVVPAERGRSVDPAALTDLARRTLPDYMVPSSVIVLDSLPLTVNGKLDRKALPAPHAATASAGAPRTAREEILCALFAEVLDLSRVGADDDFFGLGGHSMLAMRLVSRARTALGVRISIGDLFQAPTASALAALLAADDGTTTPAGPPTAVADRPEHIPLSYAQQRLWFLGQVDGPSPTYNIPLALRLTGRVDASALRAALGDVLGRHEALRTLFPAPDGEPHQLILPAGQAEPSLVELRVPAAALDEEVARAARHSFDVTTEIPLRAWLFEAAGTDGQEGTGEYVLLILLHHIAGDGLSMRPLLRDLTLAYEARLAGAAPAFTPLPVQYADYALWQRRTQEGPGREAHERSLAHWRRALDGLPPQIELPWDRPRPAVAGHLGATVELDLPAELHQQVLDLARTTGSTLFMVLQAAVAAVLTRSGAGEDIPLGTVVAGRAEESLDDVVGFFVNTLVLRTDTSGNPGFADLLARVREADLAAYAHQDVSFDRLVEEVNPERSLAWHPLFQVLVALDDGFLGGDLRFPGARVRMQPLGTDTAKFDLSVDFEDRRDGTGRPAGLRTVLEYATELFDHATVVALGQRLVRLLEAAVADPHRPIGQLDLLSAQERQRLLTDWNGPAVAESPIDLPARIRTLAAERPDAPAVSDAHGSSSYAELARDAAAVTAALAAAGAGPDELTAVLSERSPWFVTAVVGALGTAGGYMPLDPGTPVPRAAQMLADAEVRYLLAAPALADRAREIAAACAGAPVTVVLPDMAPAPAAAPVAAPVPSPEAIAYSVFTSGSTGRPKGVLVPHRGLSNHLRAVIDLYGLDEADTIAFNAPLTFDVSIWQTLTLLLAGGRVHVFDEDTARDPQAMVEAVAAHGVTVIQIVPAVLRAILDLWDADDRTAEHCAGLRWMLVHGEELPPDLVTRWYKRFPDVPLANVYGPAECSDDVSISVIRPESLPSGGRAPIGRLLWNTRAYVLDARLETVPVGVPGELYVAGAGLARGYAQRPALTAERFVADPYGEPGTRMYRTGDLARWNAAGELEFLGRVDHQTKIRGFRVEPGEVQAVIEAHDTVGQAAVLVREDRPGDKRLVAYVVPASPATGADPAAVRAHVAAALPEYMVPSSFVVLDEMPLTVNGKLDRKALPTPQTAATTSAGAPRTPREEALCALFAEVLGLPEVGVDDDFFALGGHSMLAMRLVSRVRTELGTRLAVSDLFRHPTPGRLLEAQGGEASDYEVLLPLHTPARATNGGERPLFCVHPATGLAWSYAPLARDLPEELPVYGIQAPGLTAGAPVPEDFATLIDLVARQIRTVQPEGPYRLLGWSLGGNIAQALAARFRASGDTVELLALVDSYPGQAWPYPDYADEAQWDAYALLATLAGEALEPAGHSDDFASWLADLHEDAAGRLPMPREQFDRMVDIGVNSSRLAAAWDPETFDGTALFFTATEGRDADGPTPEAWLPHVSRLDTIPLACAHEEAMADQPRAVIAQTLIDFLEAAAPAPRGTDVDTQGAK